VCCFVRIVLRVCVVARRRVRIILGLQMCIGVLVIFCVYCIVLRDLIVTLNLSLIPADGRRYRPKRCCLKPVAAEAA
jgi:hypothetical protein